MSYVLNDGDQGSVYVKKFADILSKQAHCEDLNTMLTEVYNKVYI